VNMRNDLLTAKPAKLAKPDFSLFRTQKNFGGLGGFGGSTLWFWTAH